MMKQGVPTPPPAWTPASKPGGIVWYRADTVVLSGANVTSWTEKFGNGYAATPPGTAPTQVLSVINGQPVIRFVAASNTILRFASGLNLIAAGSPMTQVVVMKSSVVGVGVFMGVLSMGVGASASQNLFLANAATYQPLNFGGGDGNTGQMSVGPAVFDSSTAFFGLAAQYSGVSGNFHTASDWSVTNNNSGISIVAGVGITNTANSQNIIGDFTGPAGVQLDGDIAEIIVWNSVLSGTDASNLHTYLNTRYGVGVG